MRHGEYTTADKREALRLYRRLGSTAETARQLGGPSAVTIRRWAVADGVLYPSRIAAQCGLARHFGRDYVKLEREVRNLYFRGGHGVAAIARSLRLPHSTVSRWCSR